MTQFFELLRVIRISKVIRPERGEERSSSTRDMRRPKVFEFTITAAGNDS